MLTLDRVSKRYATPAGVVQVLEECSVDLERGDAAVITGPSGSGKSTLLGIAGGLEPPSSGSVGVNGVDPYGLAPDALARFRNREVGFVFQNHCLLPQLTVLENTLVPTLVGEPDRDAVDRARALLAAVGLDGRTHHRPAQLGGGDRQRAAIARALIRSPALLLCDEPTGDLDPRGAAAIADLLVRLHVQQHITLLVVTHSDGIAAKFGRRLAIADGRLAPAS